MQAIDRLDKIIEKYADERGGLIPILQEIQDIYGYLPRETLSHVAVKTRTPLANIYGVATFYSQFKLNNAGENKINVCMGTACYVRGAEKNISKIRECLGMKNDTTDDGKFALEITRCVGACGLAPVISVNEDIYGNISPDGVSDILDKY